MSDARDVLRQAQAEEDRAERWLKLSTAALRLDVTTRTVRKYIACDKLRAKKLDSHHWRVSESSVLALLQEISHP